MRATGIRSLPLRTGRAIRDQLLRVEEKPVAVVVAAAGATIVVSYLLAASVGWRHVSHIVYAKHSWMWLGACLIGELLAYLGYVLTLRDIAACGGRPRDGPRGIDEDSGRRVRGVRRDPRLGRLRRRLLGAAARGSRSKGCSPPGPCAWIPRVRDPERRRAGCGRSVVCGPRRPCRRNGDVPGADRHSVPRRSRSGQPPTSARGASAAISRTGAGSAAYSPIPWPAPARPEPCSRARANTAWASSA